MPADAVAVVTAKAVAVKARSSKIGRRGAPLRRLMIGFRKKPAKRWRWLARRGSAGFRELS
jgi:hypothetical protein